MKLNDFKVIAFTHKLVDIEDIGRFHIDPSDQEKVLIPFKQNLGIEELLYISTCNRVEFAIVHDQKVDANYLHQFFQNFNPNWGEDKVNWAVKNCIVFEGTQAVRHLFCMAASIDSLVIGEREIITQVRSSFENCKSIGLCGDQIRLVIKHTIETAKEVYTETDIARNPVSVVSLAYRKLRDLDVDLNARMLVIGAGETNVNFCKYLKKHGFSDFHVFNRSIENAEKLATDVKGSAHTLEELNSFDKGFDVMLACTSSENPIVTNQLYEQLLQGETDKKVVIDLAVPAEVCANTVAENRMHYISVQTLNDIANQNKKERAKELNRCWNIIEKNIADYLANFEIRKVERAMTEVPREVKAIKKRAIEEVFAKDLEGMDQDTKAKLDEIINYFEKKYISLPMKMAREIIVGEVAKKK